MIRFRSIFAGLVCFSAAGVFGYSYLNDRTLAQNSLKWPHTQAKIVSASVERHHNKHSTNYEPKVAYQFKVGSQSYDNDTISFPNPSFDSTAEAETVARNYKVGSHVPVYYDPAKPAESCLVRGEVQAHSKEGWTALGMLVLGCVVFFFGQFRRGRRIS